MRNIPEHRRSARIGIRGSFPGFILALCLSGWSAHAQNPWMPLPHRASWAVDSSWGLRIDKGGSRFAAGFRGNPFLSIGDSLFYGDEGGKTWTGIAYQKSYVYRRPMPLSVGSSSGDIAWGNEFSPDSGHTWIAPGDFYKLPSALSVLNDGSILAGRTGDEMLQSADSGRTWAKVIGTTDFGTFLDIQETTGKWVFAAPEFGPPVFSRDNGLTWSPLRSNLKTPITLNSAVNYMAVEQHHFQQSVWLVSGAHTGYPFLLEIPIGVGEDSLEAVQTWFLGVPEESISAFAVWDDWGSGITRLWFGTWGHGVYASLDRGKTWKPDNAGLGDLHVEDLWVSGDGAMLVLTKDGLFRRDAPAPSSFVIKPLGPASGSGQGRVFPGLLRPAGLIRPATGGIFRLDGRNVAHRILHP